MMGGIGSNLDADGGITYPAFYFSGKRPPGTIQTI